MCVAPRLLLLDNGYVTLNAEVAAAAPLESAAPLQAATAAQAARAEAAPQALAVAFEQAFRDVGCGAEPEIARVAHLYPLSHPGPQAPLGWTLSRFSRDDLPRELANAHNQRQLQIMHTWSPTSPGRFSDLGVAVGYDGHCSVSRRSLPAGPAKRKDVVAENSPAGTRAAGGRTPLSWWSCGGCGQRWKSAAAETQ